MKLFIFQIILVDCNCDKLIQKKLYIKDTKLMNETSNPLTKKKEYAKRKLAYDNETYYEPLKIYLDLYNFEDKIPSSLLNYKNRFITAMNKAKTTLESFIKFYALHQSMEISDAKIRSWGIEKWDTKYYGDNPNRELFLDFITNVFFFKFFSLGNDNMASAEIVYVDGERSPIMGVITLNNNFPENKLSQDYLNALMLHQFTHLLGFHQTILTNDDFTNEWQYEYFDGIIQEEEVGDSIKYYLDDEYSPNVIEYANKYFGCTEESELINKIYLEIDNYNNIHWPSRFFLGEYMTKFNYPEEQVISGFTLSFLKDLIYLKIENFYTGGLMRFGKNQGCNFFNKKCMNDGVKFENDFYYPSDFNFDSNENSCSSGRLSRTVHKLHLYDSIPLEYKYFEGEHTFYGGLISTNYCPISEYETYNEDNIYINSCSKKGVISNDAKNIFGEAISDNSFCILNTLVKNDITNLPSSYSQVRAGCYNMFCTSRSLTIQVGEDFIVCPREGGHKKLNNYNGYILCPDYNLICTGVSDEEEELCNDMFDCINRKIEEKTTYDYDYISQTTQDSSKYPGSLITTDIGEETDKGICPKNCIQCKINTGCFQCREDYGLIGTNENNPNEKIQCKELEFLENNPYYKKNNLIFYPCSENCLTCQDKDTCLSCDTNYKIENGKCKEKVENCAQYEGEKCSQCKTNYYLVKEGEETYCVDDANEGNYYYSETLGESTYYVKCSFKIPHCNKCLAENNCIECINNNKDERFAIINDNHISCEDLSTNKYYLDSVDGKYKECSNQLDNCQTCKTNEYNVLNCLSCSSQDYILVHSDIDKCISSIDIGNNYNFFSDDGQNYYSCSNSQYHSVEYCLNCRNKETCLSCQEGYVLLNSNKLCISNDKILKKNYFKIDNNYYLCSEKIKGCESCTDAETCLECNIAFDLDENNKCISSALSATRYYKDPTTGKYISCEKIENCEECSSSTECTKCQNGYQLDNSSCKEININDEKQNNNNKDNDYNKLKGLAIGAIILACLAIVASILAVVFVFFKNLIFKKTKKIDRTDSANINNEEVDEIVVQSSKRTIKNKSNEQ